ncbi:Piso0_004678 [Millerozyma farinosa CBS 7064]|uniref:U three protein 23 n=1 Tax=Pichia sorbitophila (strain ATCC MYA-4447 / BCRC 22081 / CBS 7064 / NBRC 10061 / NRRL Y-12695) TaxID=559304 RepID=G8Y9G1_PICSO|nr:Piso0_004678 [Millerozyma farinosa CBS 7064]CCE85106.1 Piso0_004678 [Millerozyma farinosa CBS 7064]
MRQKRSKAYKKQMGLYVHAFKFRDPFQVLVDDEFIRICDKASLDVVRGLTRILHGGVKPMITQCCIQALYASRNQHVIDLAKSFERRKCNHSIKDPLTSGECLKSVVDVEGQNKHRYIVATQDVGARKHFRKVPGTPLIYMNPTVMVMEPLSDASSKVIKDIENRKLTGGLNDVNSGKIVPEQAAAEQDGQPPVKKRKGPKGPNPLSVKKKKSNPEAAKAESKSEDEKKKRKRKRSHKSHKSSEATESDENKNAASPTPEAPDNNENSST